MLRGSVDSVNTLWPQYLSCNSGVWIWLVFYFYYFDCANGTSTADVSTDSSTTLSHLWGYLQSVPVLENKHTFEKASVSSAQHWWNLDKDFGAFFVECCNYMIVKNTLLLLFNFCNIRSHIVMWQKCLKSNSLLKLEVFFSWSKTLS